MYCFYHQTPPGNGAVCEILILEARTANQVGPGSIRCPAGVTEDDTPLGGAGSGKARPPNNTNSVLYPALLPHELHTKHRASLLPTGSCAQKAMSARSSLLLNLWLAVPPVGLSPHAKRLPRGARGSIPALGNFYGNPIASLLLLLSRRLLRVDGNAWRVITRVRPSQGDMVPFRTGLTRVSRHTRAGAFQGEAYSLAPPFPSHISRVFAGKPWRVIVQGSAEQRRERSPLATGFRFGRGPLAQLSVSHAPSQILGEPRPSLPMDVSLVFARTPGESVPGKSQQRGRSHGTSIAESATTEDSEAW
jgi:hypothetical protein